MKSLNIARTSKFGWLKCCQEIPSALVAQNIAKLVAGINTHQNIHLIQACIYCNCYNTLSKGH